MTVLLVEDDPGVRELVEDALRDRGMEVRSVDGAQDACAILEFDARSCALLVTDINLGRRMTGFDVANLGRELNPDLKVIFITGDPDHLRTLAIHGAMMFPKPFSADNLADEVCGLLSPR